MTEALLPSTQEMLGVGGEEREGSDSLEAELVNSDFIEV